MNKLIVFTASWCGPCKQMKPGLLELAEQYDGSILMYDADEHMDEREFYAVRAVPTIIVLNSEGDEIDRKLGAQPKSSIEKLLLG